MIKQGSRINLPDWSEPIRVDLIEKTGDYYHIVDSIIKTMNFIASIKQVPKPCRTK